MGFQSPSLADILNDSFDYVPVDDRIFFSQIAPEARNNVTEDSDDGVDLIRSNFDWIENVNGPVESDSPTSKDLVPLPENSTVQTSDVEVYKPEVENISDVEDNIVK